MAGSNCNERNMTVFSTAKVISNKEISTDVSCLSLSCNADKLSLPLPGQFFMLRAKPSSVLLCRPISVFSSKKIDTIIQLDFLILKRGKGTSELCDLQVTSQVDLIGPLGNTFPQPQGFPVAIIGGGIGVAPVAGFASTLSPSSYDFYACFRTGSYGLETIKPSTLIITTNDGTCGIRGMLPVVFTTDVIHNNGYKAVYACGPEAMLLYVQKTCLEAKIPFYLSMESRMACGVGACLGCTIHTTEGNRRCCKDGPVFNGEKIIFNKNLTKRVSQDIEQRR